MKIEEFMRLQDESLTIDNWDWFVKNNLLTRTGRLLAAFAAKKTSE